MVLNFVHINESGANLTRGKGSSRSILTKQWIYIILYLNPELNKKGKIRDPFPSKKTHLEKFISQLKDGICSGEDPEHFLAVVGGAPHPHRILPNFPQNFTKLKEFIPPGEHVSKILLCRSATAL